VPLHLDGTRSDVIDQDVLKPLRFPATASARGELELRGIRQMNLGTH
jgi:hypothetical protein